MWVIWDGYHFVTGQDEKQLSATDDVGFARKFSTPADAYIFAEWSGCLPEWVPIRIEDIPARAA